MQNSNKGGQKQNMMSRVWKLILKNICTVELLHNGQLGDEFLCTCRLCDPLPFVILFYHVSLQPTCGNIKQQSQGVGGHRVYMGICHPRWPLWSGDPNWLAQCSGALWHPCFLGGWHFFYFWKGFVVSCNCAYHNHNVWVKKKPNRDRKQRCAVWIRFYNTKCMGFVQLWVVN